MAQYPRSAYAPLHARARALLPRAYPSQRGWGPGWPNCQREKMVPVDAGGVRVSVRREIAELVRLLIETTELMGYDVRHPPETGGGTWGFSCRAIKGATGDQPSWHSWGLAVDINATRNPLSTRFVSNIPPPIITLWESCGFYWGGRFTGLYDAMHQEKLGTPSDVAADLRTAQAAYDRLAPKPPPPPEDTVTAEQVKALQTMLNTLGANLVVDGAYGPATDAALKAANRTATELIVAKTRADRVTAAADTYLTSIAQAVDAFRRVTS